VLRKADRPLFVTSQTSLGRSADVFCACQIIQIFTVVRYVVRAVHKLDFGLLTNETRNKWGQGIFKIQGGSNMTGTDCV
jgi:hypothetical protein